MSYIINLEDDVQPNGNKSFAEEWLKNIQQNVLELIKTNFVKSTFIHKIQRQKLNLNGCRTVIEYSCAYQSYFKISVTVDFTYFIKFQTHIKYNIISQHWQIMDMFPLLKQTIKQLQHLKNAYQGIFRVNHINGITVQLKDNFHPVLKLFNKYLQKLFQKLKQPYSICQSIFQELQNISHNTCSSTLEYKKYLKSYQYFGMTERQNQNYKQFFQNQNGGKSFLKNTVKIKDNNNQILRSVTFYQNYNRKEITLNKDLNQRFHGSYSSLTLIESFGAIINTFHQQRQKSKQEDKIVDHEPGKKEGFYRLVRKQVGGKQSARDEATKSLQNQILYIKLKGNYSVPYICNYFFEFIHSSKLPQCRQIGRQSTMQIYSEFHQISIWDMFYQGRPFTLLDILNFGEQLMNGLISFFLDLDYLHRDIKETNIMVNSDGVIQIIDFGSSYQFTKSKTSKILKQEKKKFDPTLRSTLYVKKEIFNQDPHLIAKYKSYICYKHASATHRTFDVYSVGIMLSEILEVYQLLPFRKWMEVSQKLKRLTLRMTQKDFEYRIQMEQARDELRKIRNFIFQQPKN